ncbi:OLC1v1029217C1 [Oldenlandia corymbosa var. corymbosa]|uniref:OLC1v1029217C1 n=1 Tax=Oldenlandia corymbosa var. corymbosa TaxID=529605 RepID=A0AAV1CFE6_OLDCO|nr:OLC1v1029217C1 [Oldenlandia corymbosa var. corymbosa]
MWKEYAHFEMRNGCLSRARLAWLNSLQCCPHVGELWKEHIQMEEHVGNFQDIGLIFEQWMKEQPSKEGWLSYIEFELRYSRVESARGIFERFVEWSPKNCYAWIEYAALERSLGEIERARSIFERAFDQPKLEMADLLWKAYVDFSKSCLGEVSDVDQLLRKRRTELEAKDFPWMMDLKDTPPA